MEVNVGHLQNLSIRIDSGMFARKPSGSVRFLPPISKQQKLPPVVSAFQQPLRLSNRCRTISVGASCYRENISGLALETENFHPFDKDLLLKNKSQEVQPHLNGKCIYLVGMMGSGKTTIGKILAKELSYAFSDSDTLVEQEVGGTSVAEIFKLYGEDFFRDKETEVLRKLSSMHGFVISTGGGIVVRPINWKYMQNGISIWLDVPLEALAKRIAAVGTDSRPLLHNESGNGYTKAFRRLSVLLEERGDAYTNANVKVCLGSLAAKLGLSDVCNLTPEDIAIEALVQIQHFVEHEDGYCTS
ncbi:shikimate kinase 1, chloroplastic-like [Cucurbita moschata]|uniref:shikimate kinase n=1 Tax=Cucurbita moschata TaxID=3662 RepID=A0A6J1HHP4_CUCMO|nr:shikimate kinase 1, chloroplastic-like [Cucurbita moschata]XP_022963332.1 shikimate kinase 1, chloroplastic-like [Cucurbita moschata]XP_022963333.1 shikimate kinase 1, chloroplastic-like [Cucurbita moschata]